MSDYVATYIVRQRGKAIDHTAEVRHHEGCAFHLPPCCDAPGADLPAQTTECFRRCPHCGAVTTIKRVE